MTSAITTTNIDGAFPIAGQDNNSQGFRDNFTNIKTGLNTAKSEITALQTNAAKLNDDNDFNGKIIQNAEINQVYGSVRDNGTISTTTGIDIENGPLQIYTLAGSATLQFTNWPASDLYAKIRLHLDQDTTTLSSVTITGTAGQFETTTPTTLVVGQAVKVTGTLNGTGGTISGYATGAVYYIITTNGTTTFTLSSTFGGNAITTTTPTPGVTTGLIFTRLRTVTFTTPSGAILKSGDGAAFPSPFILNINTVRVVEAWTYDAGTTVYLKYLGEFT